MKKVKIIITLLLLVLLSGSSTRIKIAEPFAVSELNTDKLRLDLMGLSNLRKYNDVSFEDLKYVLVDDLSDQNYYFIKVVEDSKIEDGVWKYNGKVFNGKWHLGVDYGFVKKGTNIKAPLNMYIIKADGSYSKYGSLESKAGKFLSGGGNEVYAIAEMYDTIYGFIFMHCNDVLVKEGQIVRQGATIATVGSSGCTSSAHCHLEMFILGKGNLSEYIDKSYSNDFNVGRGYKAYSNRCFDKDGNKRKEAPCILDPTNYIPS